VGSRQLVVFAIGEEEFGIDIEHVNSIEKMLELFKIPNTPDYIEGLVNLRGKVHTVFNLRKRFRMPCPDFTENTKIIMANTSASVIGIIVDEVKKIIKVDESEFEATPKALSNLRDKFLSGIVIAEDRVIMLLDVEKIVSAEDFAPVR
jgi:purine-binding chemotaxis protein CheW